jgi:hypothetical protein
MSGCEKCDQCGGCRQQPKLIIGCRPGSEKQYEEMKRKQMEQAQEDMATVIRLLNLDWQDKLVKEHDKEIGDVIGGGFGWKLNDQYPYDHTKFTSDQFLHHMTGGERSTVDPSLRKLIRDSFHRTADKTFFTDSQTKE